MTTRDKLVETIRTELNYGHDDAKKGLAEDVADKVIAAFPVLTGGLTEEERAAVETTKMYLAKKPMAWIPSQDVVRLLCAAAERAGRSEYEVCAAFTEKVRGRFDSVAGFAGSRWDNAVSEELRSMKGKQP